MKVYSKKPHVVGYFHVGKPEMMFVQDMPVAMPGTGIRLPPHLKCFREIVHQAALAGRNSVDQYVYLSAKRMFVTPESNYNRPGWHIDGFGTDDLNYIWYDSFPTELCVDQEFELSNDHALSMVEMEQQVKQQNIVTYPRRMLIELDNTIVHRVAPVDIACVRTFVKVSISYNKYNREGNAHNHEFNYQWDMVSRSTERNDPAYK